MTCGKKLPSKQKNASETMWKANNNTKHCWPNIRDYSYYFECVEFGYPISSEVTIPFAEYYYDILLLFCMAKGDWAVPELLLSNKTKLISLLVILSNVFCTE